MRRIEKAFYTGLSLIAFCAAFQLQLPFIFESPVSAEELLAEGKPMQSAEMGGSKKEPCNNDPGAPCQSHDATSSDFTYDGIRCQQVTGAKACNTQGAICGTGDAGKCRTLLNYQGMCKCFCIYPGY